MIFTICFLNRRIKETVSFPPPYFYRRSLRCCGLLSCSSLVPHLHSHDCHSCLQSPRLPSGSLLPTLWQRTGHLLKYLFISISEDTLSLSASQELIFTKVLALDFQSCVKFDPTWPTWAETDLQSDHICHIFTENKSKKSIANSLVS